MLTFLRYPAAVLVLILLAAAGFWYFSKPDFSMRKPIAGENIIAFGDSLVAGQGADSGNDFVSVLSRKIGQPIINAGRSGDTTERALLRLEEDVLSRDPRVVIILLGGNDFIVRVPPEEVFQNLEKMIEEIQAEGAGVVLVGIRGSIFGSREADFKRLAREKRAGYVPKILNGIFGNSELMSDYNHPNDEGYKMMADRIEPVLKKMLK